MKKKGKAMKRPITIGFLGHVDSGKTSLIESLLFRREAQNGQEERKKQKILDRDSIEKRRGLTIFAKEARLIHGDQEYIFIDTPGHKDFAPEIDRILPVLDLAVLIIDPADGAVGLTKTLWKLLKEKQIPVFLVVNKADQERAEPGDLLEELKEDFEEGLVDFQEKEKELKEALAMASPTLMDQYLKEGDLSEEAIKDRIQKREIFPLFWTSAVKGQGIEAFFQALVKYSSSASRTSDFQALVYQISFDEKKNRLTHIRLFGGSLRIKETLSGEKVHEIRLYHGNTYETVPKISAGQLACLIGPAHLYPGQSLGISIPGSRNFQPVFRYQMQRADGGSFEELLQLVKKYQDIFPDLQVHPQMEEKTIDFFAMGPVFLEVLEEKFQEEGVPLTFSPGSLLYQETLEGSVIGVGHFEPLRHYAEVHLLLEEAGRNQGKTFNCSLKADASKQSIIRAIEEAAMEEIPGVLTGAPLTDIKISLLSFEDSSHSQAQDFHQATKRAIRQGLMEGKSLLLEPDLAFSLDLPQEWMGRAYQELSGLPIEDRKEEKRPGGVRFYGHGPASALMPYFSALPQESRGKARIDLWFSGYTPCPNPDEVIEASSYDPLEDPDFPPGSIFCAHGAGFSVPWNEVKDRASLSVKKGGLSRDMGQGLSSNPLSKEDLARKNARKSSQEKRLSLGPDEVKKIFRETFYANSDRAKEKKRAEKYQEQKRAARSLEKTSSALPSAPRQTKDISSWLLVDGYNILHEWPGLREYLESDFDHARTILIDKLTEFRTFIDAQIIIVFDAYKVKGGKRSVQKIGGLYVVFTREAETADEYIEEVARKKCPQDRVTIASSDGPVQMIGFKEGALILSSRDFIEYVENSRKMTLRDFQKKAPLPLVNKISCLDKSLESSNEKEKR